MPFLTLLFILMSFISASDAVQKQVIFVTVPKSGTWLLNKAIENLTGTIPKPIETLETGPLPVTDLKGYLHQANFAIYLTHLFPKTDQIRTFSSQEFTKVLLIRDPRDVIVSFANHLARQYPWPYTHIQFFERFAQLSLDEQIEQVLLFPPLGPRESILLAAEWMNDPDIHVIRFEDLVGQAGGGSDEAQLAALTHLGELMGLSLSKEKIEMAAKNLFGGTRSFHKGQIGAWKTSYNHENKALFNALLGEARIRLGYGTSFGDFE